MEQIRIFASCHNHSTYSDGEYTPEVLARIAKNMGHGGIILTDHDTVAGYPFMKAAAEKYGLKTMIGCEFSTCFKGRGFHLCGYDFDPTHPEMAELLRIGSMIQTKRTELLFKWGLERGSLREGITWQDVLDDHPNHTYFCNNEVFASYMKRGIYRYDEYDDVFLMPNFSYSLGYEDKIHEITGISYDDVHTDEVIRIVKAAGGVSVIAHPHNKGQYAKDLIDAGVMGFETRHSMLTPEEHEFYEKLCEEHGLYKMGGSDHEGVLGGLMTFPDPSYDCPYEHSGVTEEDFMTLYERKLG
jgi:hypothetical protein